MALGQPSATDPLGLGYDDRAAAVSELQRLLLAILRGQHRAFGAWHSRAGIMGYPPNVVPIHPNMVDVRRLRERIRDLDPDALLYASWGGPMP
jgi:hypothetical protein